MRHRERTEITLGTAYRYSMSDLIMSVGSVSFLVALFLALN